MQVDSSALDDIKARLDDLDDVVKGIRTNVAALIVKAFGGSFDRGAIHKLLDEATHDLQRPAAFDSTRT